MTAPQPSQSEIVDRLQKICASRQRMFSKLQRLNVEETDLLARLQTLEKNESTGKPDFSRFKDMTSRLLTEFWNAPNRILSHEDIRQDVIFDEEAKDKTVWQVVCRARKELIDARYPYEIKSIDGKGYQLVDTTPDKSTKTPKTP